MMRVRRKEWVRGVRFAELEKVMKKVARSDGSFLFLEIQDAMQSGEFLRCFDFAKIKDI
jgi:hypothetical protein